MSQPDANAQAIHQAVTQQSGFVDQILSELSRVIVGQKNMIERLLIGLLTGGHVLVEGVPGLAKTLAVKSLSDTLNASFQRIQFTPDLLPADITGTTIYESATGQFRDRFGPVFANLVLADEINRAPAKVQAALLEAMQERQVTIGDNTHKLPSPFLVLATQNPIEQEGTYRLPEAQLDRFMLMVNVEYPSWDEERRILDLMTAPTIPSARCVVEISELVKSADLVKQIYVDPQVRDYIVHLVYATRTPGRYGLGEVANLISHGASPRATIFLTKAAQGHAFLQHRGYVTPDDIKAIALDVLRHRVAVTYEAEAEEIGSQDVVRRVLERIPVP